MADHKATIGKLYEEAVNGRNMDVIDEFVKEDVIENEEFPGIASGREGVKQFFRMMVEAFPDLRFDVQDVIAEGDRVAARCVMTGTHQGQFMDIPATGKKVTVHLIDIFRFEGGKLAEHWGVTDQVSMLQQMGVIPE
jgi:steroid delta-isomerase-like uncharacterized protein